MTLTVWEEAVAYIAGVLGGEPAMTKITEGAEKRAENRRRAERRQVALPIAGNERRVKERRAARDRRA